MAAKRKRKTASTLGARVRKTRLTKAQLDEIRRVEAQASKPGRDDTGVTEEDLDRPARLKWLIQDDE